MGITHDAGITDDSNGLPPGGTTGQVATKASNKDYDVIWAAGGGGGGSVTSVTGLNTNNADPANPVVRISVDGVTVTGLGTPGSPLVATASGTGDVVGPGSATDNAISRFDTTTGKLIQNSVVTVGDTGVVAGASIDTASAANILKVNGTSLTATIGSGAVVLATSPTITTGVFGSSTATTQAPADNSTKLATTAYVDNAVLGQNFKEAAKYASTAALPSIVYANGASGVGATLTGVALAAISLDGASPGVGDRVLIKNQASTFQNGIYTVTQTGSGIAVFILTRATDADQSTDYKTGDSLFVSAGNTLATTTWAYTGVDSPTMGTDALTFVQTAGQGSFTQGNGIAITGVSIAIDTAVTLDKTTVQTASNKTFVAPALGTPVSGVLTNCTGTVESTIVFTDITTNNVTSTAHGFAPKSPADATKFLNGAATPAYGVPATIDNLTGAFASAAAAVAGYQYWPNDGYTTLRDTGAAMVPWGPIFPLTSPTGLTTWVNQGTSTLTTTNGGYAFLKPAAGNTTDVALYVGTAPGTPWTRTFGFIPNIVNKGVIGCGVAFRQSSDGKFAYFGLIGSSTAPMTLISGKFTSATVFSANYVSYQAPQMAGMIWLRIADDGTNRVCSMSLDGINFSILHTIGRTDFMTADQYGIFMSAQNTATTNLPVYMNVQHLA